MDANEFLHEKLKGWPEKEWHQPDVSDFMDCECGDKLHTIEKLNSHIKEHNPIYSTMPIQDLIARLVEIGEWEKFLHWAHQPPTSFLNY